MQIILRSIGDLREYFGRDPQPIALPEGALVEDLLRFIGERWGPTLPGYMWEPQASRFRGPFLLVIGGKAVRDPRSPLEDGVEIRVMNSLAGG